MDNRPAHITPSGFKKIMTGGRGGSKFGKTAQSYAEEIVQRMIGVEIEDYVSAAMQWGIDNEPLAMEAYETAEVVQTEEKERITHPEYDYISGEPDGLVGNDGVVEIKCPNSNNHFKNLLEGEQVDKYMYQMQGYMWLTDRQWCDFVSFDPRYPKKYELYIQRIDRDQELIDQLEERCVEFWNELVLPTKERFLYG